MLKRCYSETTHKKRETYRYCFVSNEWLTFMNFRSWMVTQNWRYMDLDKDIIKIGNKEYSKNNCVFVSRKLNTFLLDCAKLKGLNPTGVDYIAKKGLYRAQISIDGKKTYLGLFKTKKDARKSYIKSKINLLNEFINKQKDERIINGLLERIVLMELEYCDSEAGRQE